MIEETRIQPLNNKPPAKGEYVLYWMQASQRTEYNHALELAVKEANRRKLPVVVYFGLTASFPEANRRHYSFMLEGLKEIRQDLYLRGIGWVVEKASPQTGVLKYAKRAALAVCDRGYLGIQKNWRRYVAGKIDCSLLQVESDVVVPVEAASGKQEYSAATLRRKLHKVLDAYLVPIQSEAPRIKFEPSEFDSLDISDIGKVISDLDIDHSVGPVESFHGGTREASRHLDRFIRHKLDRYTALRNDPNEDVLSNLSPYLHFGQISPLYVALSVLKHNNPAVDAFLEELVVRRELSMNFVHYNPYYDSFNCLPDWARRTLREHENDPREYDYLLEELEGARTHDRYWNAAQRQMLATGKMHGYMRMYWGKKILEWTKEPQKAFRTALYLNNKYELDGRDPNGFAGVAWCFGKHDRPWGRRPVFGSVRYMSADGLKRKFDAEAYARRNATGRQ